MGTITVFPSRQGYKKLSPAAGLGWPSGSVPIPSASPPPALGVAKTIDFTVNPGEAVGITQSTARGKSTLLPR